LKRRRRIGLEIKTGIELSRFYGGRRGVASADRQELKGTPNGKKERSIFSYGEKEK